MSGAPDLGEAGAPHIGPTLADLGLLDSPSASALACIIHQVEQDLRQGGAGLQACIHASLWNCGLQPLRSLCRNSPRAVEVEHEPSFCARGARYNVAHGVSRGSKSPAETPTSANCGQMWGTVPSSVEAGGQPNNRTRKRREFIPCLVTDLLPLVDG